MTEASDAHTIAMEWLKHLITLSSSIVVFSGAFAGDFIAEPNLSLLVLGISWASFLATIMLCLDTISSITYSRINSDDSWTTGRGKRTARASKYCFSAGVLLFALFAGANLILPLFGQ